MKPLTVLDSHRLKMLFEYVDRDRAGVIDIAALTRGVEDDAQVRDASPTERPPRPPRPQFRSRAAHLAQRPPRLPFPPPPTRLRAHCQLASMLYLPARIDQSEGIYAAWRKVFSEYYCDEAAEMSLSQFQAHVEAYANAAVVVSPPSSPQSPFERMVARSPPVAPEPALSAVAEVALRQKFESVLNETSQSIRQVGLVGLGALMRAVSADAALRIVLGLSDLHAADLAARDVFARALAAAIEGGAHDAGAMVSYQEFRAEVLAWRAEGAAETEAAREAAYAAYGAEATRAETAAGLAEEAAMATEAAYAAYGVPAGSREQAEAEALAAANLAAAIARASGSPGRSPVGVAAPDKPRAGTRGVTGAGEAEGSARASDDPITVLEDAKARIYPHHFDTRHAIDLLQNADAVQAALGRSSFARALDVAIAKERAPCSDEQRVVDTLFALTSRPIQFARTAAGARAEAAESLAFIHTQSDVGAGAETTAHHSTNPTTGASISSSFYPPPMRADVLALLNEGHEHRGEAIPVADNGSVESHVWQVSETSMRAATWLRMRDDELASVGRRAYTATPTRGGHAGIPGRYFSYPLQHDFGNRLAPRSRTAFPDHTTRKTTSGRASAAFLAEQRLNVGRVGVVGGLPSSYNRVYPSVAAASTRRPYIGGYISGQYARAAARHDPAPRLIAPITPTFLLHY